MRMLLSAIILCLACSSAATAQYESTARRPQLSAAQVEALKELATPSPSLPGQAKGGAPKKDSATGTMTGTITFIDEPFQDDSGLYLTFVEMRLNSAAGPLYYLVACIGESWVNACLSMRAGKRVQFTGVLFPGYVETSEFLVLLPTKYLGGR